MINTLSKWDKYVSEDKIMNNELVSFNKNGVNEDFNMKMSFGTAGIRGILGAGLNKINIVTISLAARAYAKFLSKQGKSIKQKGIVIANDNRHNGSLYKDTIVKIFNKYGIKTYVMKDDELMATPVLSYLIRKLEAAGGINITASHNPKEYNGFKVYNNLGGQLMPKDTKEISKIMDDLDPFEDERGKYSPTFIEDKIIDEYVNKVTDLKISNEKNISVVYSPMHGTGIGIGKRIIENLGVSVSYVEKQMTADPNFTNTKSPNPEDYKSYSLAIKQARKTKSELIVITDPDSDRVGAVVKYKRRFKYLNGNELASLYLEYYLDHLKRTKKLPKDGYIVKSMVSTDLATKIASKYGVETREVHVGFKNIADTIENSKGTFLFGFEESYGFLINSDIARDKDAFQGIAAIIDMAIHYKNQGITLFDQLINLQKEYRVHRNIQKSSIIDSDGTKRVLDGLSKTKEVYGKKVDKVIDFRDDKKEPMQMVKVIFKDGSWIVARPSGTEPKVKYYVQSIGKKGDSLINSVVAEKKMFEYIDEKAEYFPPKKFTWKVIVKYSIFVTIMVGLLALVFKGIYGTYSSHGSSATSAAIDWYNEKAKYIFLIGIAGMFFNIFVDAWMKYRLLKFHGENVKVRHLIISAIMGSIISYLTPLAIGGDGIGYWYLRRRGLKRAPLASTFLTSTILWQMKNLVLTAILLPMGLHMFKDLLTNGTPESKSVMIIFVIGLAWDIFSIFMLWTILISKRFQEWIISTTIKLLEWFRWTHISDPGAKASSFMAEFADLRYGMKKIWKSPKILTESMFYEMLPKLFSIAALLNIWLGVVNSNLEYGSYWSQVVATDVVNTANSFSLTPGSTGFIEFISLQIRQTIYVSDGMGGNSEDTVIHLDIINKFVSQWPYLILSSMLAIIIVIGESRIKLYSTSKKGEKENTTFYKKISFVWPLFITGWMLWLFLL